VSEWWTYRAENFLLFSERAYWRMFEIANATHWPLAVALFAIGVVGTFALAHQMSARTALFGGPDQRVTTTLRVALLVISVGALWVAWNFFYTVYAPINWAAHYVAIAFALSGFFTGVFALTASYAIHASSVRRVIAVALMMIATLVYPLLSLAQGRGFSQAEVFLVAPDPTMIATLGVLLALCTPSIKSAWALRVLFAIPLGWLSISSVTLATLGSLQWIAPAVAVALTMVGALVRIR
jgi:hypothetical protein